MKKTFDAVAVMREAREKLAAEWEGKPREQEIESLRRKHSSITNKKKRVKS
jgi:hypothetical protein